MRFEKVVARAIHTQTNAARDEHADAPALSPEQPLIDGAIGYARDLADARTLTHQLHGSNPGERTGAYRGAGETLATAKRRGSPSDVAEYVVDEWLHSKIHADVMLGAGYSYHGVGVWETHGTIYVVALYAKRKPLRQYAADIATAIR
jgi:uncharacterized protein YkwD